MQDNAGQNVKNVQKNRTMQDKAGQKLKNRTMQDMQDIVVATPFFFCKNTVYKNIQAQNS